MFPTFEFLEISLFLWVFQMLQKIVDPPLQGIFLWSVWVSDVCANCVYDSIAFSNHSSPYIIGWSLFLLFYSEWSTFWSRTLQVQDICFIIFYFIVFVIQARSCNSSVTVYVFRLWDFWKFHQVCWYSKCLQNDGSSVTGDMFLSVLVFDVCVNSVYDSITLPNHLSS